MKKNSYTFDEAYKASLEYFKGDELAAKVFVNKYALKDAFGNIFEKTPADMHWRLANEIARIEKKYPNSLSEEELFQLFDHFKYIVPQGSPMTGIGNNYQIASLSNCFVIGLDGPADSYGAIIKIDEEQVQLMKRRGGVGHDLSHIRPKGSPVKNSALTSTGLVPFMERYSNSTREVAQDGRRGALMLSVSIKHPDAESFIDAKMIEGKVTGANVSVKITDDFMNSVINDRPFIQQYPVGAENPEYVKETDAKELWGKIVPFILLDEPLAGIDPIAVGEIRNLVSHLKTKGLGVLITDHNVRETLDIIDHAYILHEGRVMMEGDKAQVIAHEGVRKVYLGDSFAL